MNVTEYLKEKGFIDFEGYSAQNNDEVELLKKLLNEKNIKNILEIGFNAGHSSEIFLESRNDIYVTSFDMGIHRYVKVAKQYIDKTYPTRHKLIYGDSRITLPEYIENNSDKKFDLIFIDGGHYHDVPQRDLFNCKLLSHEDTIVIMDDTMNNPDYINAWNIMPNKAWRDGIANKYIKEMSTFDFNKTHGLSYGKYIF
jgi:predicted O-methyltransferase YrrM